MASMTDANTGPAAREPQRHRTIDRVTQILEEVVYHPGMTFAELSRVIDAPKSSVHGFVQGLLAAGWLHQDPTGFYLGPAIHGLTLASGHLRAGSVTDQDLQELQEEVQATVFLGIRAGDELIYVSEAGADLLFDFAARKNIRRGLLSTAGGKVLLAESPQNERDQYLRRRPREESHLVEEFLSEFDDIRRTRIAYNRLHNGARLGIASAVYGHQGRVAGEITIVGRTEDLAPRQQKIEAALLKHIDAWRARMPRT